MEYQRRIQRLLSCIAVSVVKIAGSYNYSSTRYSHNLELPNEEPVTLDGTYKLMLNVQPYFRVRRTGTQGASYHVEIVGYHYIIHDSEQREILSYHWHPRSRDFVQTPHLHLGIGARVGFDPLVSKTHLPTGHINFSDIIRVLIQDLEVQPIRSDWATLVQGIIEPTPA